MIRIFFTIFIAISLLPINGQIKEAKRDSNTGLYGFVDKNGNWIVKPMYAYAHWNAFDGNYGFVSMVEMDKVRKTNGYAIIDENGKRITDFCYSNIFRKDPFGPFTVTKAIGSEKRKGVVSQNGQIIISAKNDEVWVYSPDFAGYCPFPIELIIVENDGKESVYDWKGKRILMEDYQTIAEWTFKNPTFRVKNNDKYGLFSIKGKGLLECTYDDIREGGDGIHALPIKDGKMGLYNPILKKYVIPMEYDDIKPSGIENLFIVKKSGKYGLHGLDGLLIPCDFSSISKFENDVATVTKDGKVTLMKNPLLPDSDIQLANLTSKKKTNGETRAVSKYPAPNSDVDKDIPQREGSQKESSMFAFIIANENYSDAPVPYALNDGRMFAEYCNKSLGIPTSNIKMFEDATYANIISAVEQMKDIADAYSGEASMILYYAGHGIPDEEKKSAYLFPIDGQLRNMNATSYSLEKLYKELSEMPFKETVVFLDACFSGAKREDEMLLAGRGIAIKVNEEKPVGDIVVFSASTGNETAHQLADKTHGLFTYYLLKGIQQSNGNISLGELTDYVTKNVKRQSVVINSKKQTPTVIPSANMADRWRDVRL